MGKQAEMVKLQGNGMHRPVPQEGNSGEKTTDLKDLDESKLNDPALVTSVEERLANLRDITRPARGGKKNPAAEDEENDEPDLEEEGGDDVTLPAKEDGGKADSDDSPTRDEDERTLPEAYVTCAEAYGWKREEVLEEFKANPDRALRTLSNIYNARNKASAQFAALGRKAKEQQADESEAKAKPKFQPVDTAKLKEQFGDEAGPLIEMIEAQNKTLQQLAEQMPAAKPKERRVFNSKVEETGVEQQIFNFFESDRMKLYEKVYGSLGIGETFDDLAPGQREHRWRVLEKADQIAGGAALQGVEMTLEEALESAHMLVTQKYRDQILIDGIKEKVVKRNKGISLKPSAGTRKPGQGAVDDGKPGTRTREQLVASTQRKLDKLYGG